MLFSVSSYRYCKNKPYPKSRFCRGVPGNGVFCRGVPGNGVFCRGVPGNGVFCRGVPGNGHAGRGFVFVAQCFAHRLELKFA